MAAAEYLFDKLVFLLFLVFQIDICFANDILGCGGFVKSHVNLDYSKIEIGLYTKQGSLKERSECAPTNGYYFLPFYEKGEYVLKVHPPAGWSFEPNQVDLVIDGTTDSCSMGQDINFVFNGFGITGKVLTAGQKQGPSGISVQLIDETGQKRETVTEAGGDFHFTPVIPGKYTLKASHPRWKLDPAQAVVQVIEGNTVLPTGVLTVKGFDVKGSVVSFGAPIRGIYVLLYSKEESPKFRVEGCNTALLQGVPDAPICHSITDSSGEFSFGLVPAGEYRLLALPTSPGQASVTYNVKPEKVQFTVLHDSLYIKNAFEVTGFTVVGSVLRYTGGAGVNNVRVLKDGKPVGTTDKTGKFTLPSLEPGTYGLSFQHEHGEFPDITVAVSARGPDGVPAAAAARWRVCGAVSPAAGHRRLAIDDGRLKITVQVNTDGNWCTYLPPGAYNARVEVTEGERSQGLQFYPLTQKISVAHGPVEGIMFSQLKARITGRVECTAKACVGLQVTLRSLSTDGTYVGQPLTTHVKDGQYAFEDVLPGSVEVSVPTDRLCWGSDKHVVDALSVQASAPPFRQIGHAVSVTTTHQTEIEYSSASGGGVFTAPAGTSLQCVDTADRYTMRTRGCHRFNPDHAEVDTSAEQLPSVQFVAVSHLVTVVVTSPVPADDVTLEISARGGAGGAGGTQRAGPLAARGGGGGGGGGGEYVYEHNMYMAEGEVAVVSATSSSLLFSPPSPRQVVGGAGCRGAALTLRGRRGVTVGGRLVPPVEGVAVTLRHDDEQTLTQVTQADGKYSFGPLDANSQFTVTAQKESYVFGDRSDNGDITAHKLAEIVVELVDDATGEPLQGGLVSVSGGAFRHTRAAGASGALRFPSLSPAHYYVRPHLKEYRFTPPSRLQPVSDGDTHTVTLRGVRVAWSCSGRLLSLAGSGWTGVAVMATSTGSGCVSEDANTEADGHFRIRGLQPDCVYKLSLGESSAPELAGLKLVRAPDIVEVKEKKDIVNVELIAIRPHQLTDINVIVHTPNVDHYRTLRLTLTQDNSHSPIFSTKLDPAGYSHHNPGLLYALPRLPADNKTYVLQLESTLSKVTHSYGEEVVYFNSDGRFKHFEIQFLPKVKSSDNELRQTSLLFVPLLALVTLSLAQRERVSCALRALAAAAGAHSGRPQAKPRAAPRPDVLDKASIDHILSTVNAAGKRAVKKKQ